MAASTPLSLLTTFSTSKLIPKQYTCRQPRRSSLSLHPGQSYSFPPFLRTSSTKLPLLLRHAYISAPGSDTIVNDADPKLPELEEEREDIEKEDTRAVSWGLLWGLLSQHKLRLAISVLTLVGCTTCTLSMPIFSGRFFEVLIGARPGPLWKLLSKVGVLYAMEPICTVIFVINMNTIWEKVMSTLRAQLFRRILIQKVEFFDRYKNGSTICFPNLVSAMGDDITAILWIPQSESMQCNKP